MKVRTIADPLHTLSKHMTHAQNTHNTLPVRCALQRVTELIKLCVHVCVCACGCGVCVVCVCVCRWMLIGVVNGHSALVKLWSVLKLGPLKWYSIM